MCIYIYICVCVCMYVCMYSILYCTVCIIQVQLYSVQVPVQVCDKAAKNRKRVEMGNGLPEFYCSDISTTLITHEKFEI